MIHTGADLKRARHALGMSVEDMRRALRLGGRGHEYLRRIEAGRIDISGPISVAVEQMMEREGLSL